MLDQVRAFKLTNSAHSRSKVNLVSKTVCFILCGPATKLVSGVQTSAHAWLHPLGTNLTRWAVKYESLLLLLYYHNLGGWQVAAEDCFSSLHKSGKNTLVKHADHENNGQSSQTTQRQAHLCGTTGWWSNLSGDFSVGGVEQNKHLIKSLFQNITLTNIKRNKSVKAIISTRGKNADHFIYTYRCNYLTTPLQRYCFLKYVIIYKYQFLTPCFTCYKWFMLCIFSDPHTTDC